MVKKYEFTGETKKVRGITLYHIRALIDFTNVKVGDLGGWIEKEDNLSHCGDAWVSGDAVVYGNADILWISKIGSRDDTVTFARIIDSTIQVSTGCFEGTIDEFEKKVIETHGSNEHAQAYMLAIQLAKLRINGVCDGKEN